MPSENSVASHYTHGGLLAAIRDGVAKLGKNIADVTIDDLAPVDEFHIGGRVATQSFLDQLDIDASHHILDVGCGLGGGSRFAAHAYGCHVTGVDITPEYVETGNELCNWVGLNDRITLEVANATALPHPDKEFDRAFMLHVGMNIANKALLASELHRVLRPGSKIGIYDVMRVSDGNLTFPVPWATEADGSSLSAVTEYKSALERSGFSIISERNRRDFALDFFAQLQAGMVNADGPPPLGLHILMGATAPVKVTNMIENISRNVIAPVEIIAVKKE